MAVAAWAQPAIDRIIETIAGSVERGDEGAAAAAQLTLPSGVALDGSGNLYIADRNNHRIRKVDAAGLITTVAGTGESGYGGDGAAATAARLYFPFDVALDGSGNLYIADSQNHRIRKVDAAGLITTVAGTGESGYGGDGGAATAAQLYSPYGVAVDGSGALYIADNRNHRIRKVDAAGLITTAAGTGAYGYNGDDIAATAAHLNDPRGVAVDGSGALYIADWGNGRIRKVDAAGLITTAAGTGEHGYSGDGGQATAAQINSPYGMAVDDSGNLYIADLGNHRIRKVDPAGVISTVAGTGERGYSGDGDTATAARLYQPFGVAVDGSGNLYIADTGNNRIRKVDPAGLISPIAGTGRRSYDGDGGPATAAQIASPSGVAADDSGNLYIADTANSRVRKVDAAGGISTVAGNGVWGYSGDGGPAIAAQITSPEGVAVDGSGNLYIADTWNNRIRKVDAAGVISTVAGTGQSGYRGDGGPAAAARLSAPRGVAADDSGNLYIADRNNHLVCKVDAAGIVSTVAGHGVRDYSGDGGPATAAGLYFPSSVAVDGSGNLYIANRGNHRIHKVDAGGIIFTVAGTGTPGYSGDGGPATAAQLHYPSGVAVDGSGNLYIADAWNHRIRRLRPTTTPAPTTPPPTTPPAPTSTVNAQPTALAFVLEQDAEPAVQTIVLTAANGEADFTVQPNRRWVAVSPSSGSLAKDEQTTIAVTVHPAGLRAVNADGQGGQYSGRLYIHTARRLTAQVRIALTVLPPRGPAVSERGVVNAAVMSALGAPGPFGAAPLPVAPGSLVVVQGQNFTGGETAEAEGFPLPASLGGVSVQFDGLEAPLFSVGPQRIEAQLPWALGMEALEAGGGALAEAVVETAESSSYPRRFFIAAHAPGIFTLSGEGTGQAAAWLAGAGILAAPRGAVGESRPARAGDVLELYATGLGPVQPPVADGENSCGPEGVCLADGSNVALRRTTARPRVSIGGVEAAEERVLFSGLAPTLAGVNAILVEVPPGLAPNDATEVIIAIGGRTSQPGVTIAVE